MREQQLKVSLENKFNEIYKNKRLLAIQLNGFNHTVFFDDGKQNDSIQIERFSHYTTMGDEESQARAKALFGDISNYAYQNNAKEFVYILPANR